ncbi:uncharacterized protein N7498_002474 [Penicillium cinerascens]|uniref:Uncharacterized protein n=1 Tax=Penicillium cinerascens TaxID=70096 RepID=A0A9W9NA48_9EURO|nr:uncharacterized protein N7498_002474 [Penicillium cinerascens]KAJ5216067.1 hypothetical protein N7498_002474 [Penicillium cinerascens]
MNSSENTKGKERATGPGGAPSIENANMTTAASASPATNSFTFISTSSKLKHAKKMAELAKVSLAEDEPTEDTTGPGTPTSTSIRPPALNAGEASKKPKSHAPRNVYDKPESLPRDFPDEQAELTDDQIRKLITQGPSFRKRYYNYFVSNGNLRRQYYHLIFEKLPSGEMRYPEYILASNLPSRSDTIQQRIQQREEREASGKPIRKKAKMSKTNEAAEDNSEPKGSLNVPEAKHKNSAPTGKEPLSTPVLMSLVDARPGPILQGSFESLPEPAVATSAAVTSEVQSPQPSRETGPPSSHSYRSRSRSGSTRPSSNSVASPPISSARNRLSRPLVRRRSRSPRRDFATSASHTSTVEAASGSTCRAENASAVLAVSPSSAASKTGLDRPMRGNPFGPRNGEGKEKSGEDKPQLYDPAHMKSPENDSIRLYLDNEIVPFIQRYETGNMDLMAMGELERSVAWIHQEVHKLNIALSTACETSSNLQFKISINDLIMRLLALQKSCWMLQEQVNKTTMEK